MATGRWDILVQDIRRIAELSAVAHRPDRELLDAFVAKHDSTAFEVLVRRYGSMVFGVCRRVLHHAQDAEDAFQATFLVLVRKAASLTRGEAVGNWLYGVAYRTALTARSRSARRHIKEAEAPPMNPQESPLETAARSEWQALLDRELNRLPDKYRAPVILCDLLGKTKKQVAEELRCPEGTVSSRLARGREMLRKRLARHGSAFGSAAGAVLLEQIATAAVPGPLYSTTIKAAALLAKGTTAAAGLTPGAVALMEGVLKSMLLTKLKPVLALILAASLLGGVAWVVASGTGEADPASAPEQPNAKKVEPPAAPPAVAAAEVQKKKELLYGDKDFNGWRDTLLTQLKPQLRIEAIKAMGAFGINGYPAEAASAVLEVKKAYYSIKTDDDDDELLDFANEALIKIGPKGFPVLVNLQESKSVNERRVAAETLVHLMRPYPDDAFALFLCAIKDVDDMVRSKAVGAVFPVFRYKGKANKLPGQPWPIAGSGFGSPGGGLPAPAPMQWPFPVHLTAAEKQDLVLALIPIFKDKDATARRNAVRIVGYFAPTAKSAIPALCIRLQEDSDLDVRDAALDVFLGWEQPMLEPAIDALIKVAKDGKRNDERVWAVQKLGLLNAKSAVPALNDLLKSIPKDVPADLVELRGAIIEALDRISSNRPKTDPKK